MESAVGLVVATAVLVLFVVPQFTGPPASVAVEEGHLVVSLRGLHQVLALRRRVTAPISQVRAVRVVARRRELPQLPRWRGIRIGTYMPGATVAGTFGLGTRAGKAFWAIQRGRALVVELAEGEFARLVVEVSDPDRVAPEIRSAVSP